MWELAYKKSWMPKNWWFWTVVLEKSLESRLDCKEIKPVSPKGNHSWIFIGRMMLKLKLQYFGHLIRRTDSLGKTLMLGKTEGRRRRGQQRMRWWMASPTRWTWVWASSESWWWTGKPGMQQSMGLQRVGQNWVTELNWADLSPPHLTNKVWEYEGGNRTGFILKAGLHLGLDCGAICPVSIETTYQLENQAPGRKSPRAVHHLKEYPNYLCNWIESYILLCLLGYDYKPIDNCPLLTT